MSVTNSRIQKNLLLFFPCCIVLFCFIGKYIHSVNFRRFFDLQNILFLKSIIIYLSVNSSRLFGVLECRGQKPRIFPKMCENVESRRSGESNDCCK